MTGVRERALGALERTRLLDRIGQAVRLLDRSRLAVLTYHRVAPDEESADALLTSDVVDASASSFDAQLRELARHHRVIDTEELEHCLDRGELPDSAAMITFDDGYRECVDIALPILQRHRMPAVFFIPTRFVSERRLYWWDRIDYLVETATRTEPTTLAYPYPLTIHPADKNRTKRVLHRIVKNVASLDLERFLEQVSEQIGARWRSNIEAELVDRMVMSWDHIRQLRAAGMDIQSHTRSHRPLHTMPHDQLVTDLRAAKDEIEREVGSEVRAISYPVGRSICNRPTLLAAVRDAGYRLGFTNGSGINRHLAGCQRLDLRRMAVDRDTSMTLFRGLLAIPQLAYVSGHHD